MPGRFTESFIQCTERDEGTLAEAAGGGVMPVAVMRVTQAVAWHVAVRMLAMVMMGVHRPMLQAIVQHGQDGARGEQTER